LLLLGLLALPGGAFAAHSVRLSWNPSASAVAKYRIYRLGGCTKPPSVKATVLSPTIAWTDTQVVAGRTYCYQVTAIDRFGNESVPSNRIRAKIPTP
jgi:fibronectin type 3 domain-containing protein